VGTIHEEIKQTKPFPSVAQEAMVGILRTADLVRRQATRFVGTQGLTAQQYNVLRILRGAGNAGLPTLEVADRMIEETPGVTRLLDRLETKELVRRQRCEKDRRQHLCWITAKGLAVLKMLDLSNEQYADEVLVGLTAKERGQLIHLLDKLRAAHPKR